MLPLTVHSHYSLMHATAGVRALCRRARQLGYPALGLTDRNNLHGLWPFLAACREENIAPIIGAEILSAQERVFCLVRNPAGYRNLCRLLTSRHMDPDFSLSRLHADQCRGLVVLTGQQDLLCRLHDNGVRVAAALIGRPGQHNAELRSLALRRSLMPVALPDVFFLFPEHYPLHRLQRAIATRTSLSRLPARQTASAHSYLAPPAEYEQRFAIWPEAVTNTRRIAEQCSSFHGPRFGIVLPPYRNMDSRTADRLLHREALQGARYRYGDPLPPAVISRLEYELAVIADMGFSSYFLVVRDIVRPVSLTCGRGSAAASLVAYCLRITNVCPIRHNLYFERFLNPGRSDPPDIDIDFAWDERDRVLAGVFSRYGRHAAMVCNHVRLQPRAAIRETARVFGLPETEIRQVCRRLRRVRLQTWPDLAESIQEIQKMPLLRGIDLGQTWPEIIRLALAIAGMPRNLSVHPGGVVITPQPVRDYVPVQPTAKGIPLIQWDKDGAEEAGLVKIDLLGNRSLGVIRDTMQQIQSSGGKTPDRHRWRPEDDPLTRKTVAAGETMGCFYIESPAMRLLQKKAAQGDFEHLVIHSSIIRPAANELIREYLRRLHGGAWQPPHPLLTNVLAETLGIMVYQEDVARVAVCLGFSHVEADRLRKIMAKKDRHAKLADYKNVFFEKTGRLEMGRKTRQEIWDMMMSFEGYSFCKAHSASYAMVSFQAAWLKSHFPAEFMAAVLSNRGGYYSAFAYVSEARRLGLRILPPDVQTAAVCWQGRQRELRVGLMAVSNLGRTTMERIVAGQRQRPFSSVHDFLQRIYPDEQEARSLIHAGALDCLDDRASRSRAYLLWQLAWWQHKGRQQGQLFVPPGTPKLPPDDRHQRLRNEFRALGFLCRIHPLSLFAGQRSQYRALTATELPRHAATGRPVRFLGWPIAGKIVNTRQGRPMEFFTFEDETGLVECTLFPAIYRSSCHLLHSGHPLLLTGIVEQEYGATTLTVRQVAPVTQGL